MKVKAFGAGVYEARRRALKESINKGKILLLGNEESSINFKDNWYPFRQDSTFLYYFGLNVPGLCALIDIDHDRDILFGDELTIDDIVWTGSQLSLAELAERVGVREVFPAAAIKKHVTSRTAYLPPYRPEHAIKINQWLHKPFDDVDTGFSCDLVKAVVSQRSVKSAEELDQLEQAATITSRMHRAVMEAARPGMKEYELVGVAMKAASEYEVPFSFPPIMTVNGHVLHNHFYGNTLQKGQMLLFDGGAESPMQYAGDMTRTFPVGTHFDLRQRELYEVVLRAHDVAVKALQPGVLFKDIHFLACRTLVEGLKGVGLMKGDAAAAVEAGAHTMFFQCGLGHMMGLDVHDMENLGEEYVGYTDTLKKSKDFGLKSLRMAKALEEGHVVTIEPGIYIIPELIDMYRSENKYENFIDYRVLETFRDFGGIRIEDDYHITREGGQLLGEPLPKLVKEVEAIRAS